MNVKKIFDLKKKKKKVNYFEIKKIKMKLIIKDP